MVLCTLLLLDYPLNMKTVTNIIYFLADMCIFQNVLTNSFWLEKIQSLLLYFKYSVLYVQLNNPKAIHNFKEPNLVGIISVKIYENICCYSISCIFGIVLLIFLRMIEFAGLTTRLEHLLKVVTYVT